MLADTRKASASQLRSFNPNISVEEIRANKATQRFLKKHGFDDIEDEFGNISRQEFSDNKEQKEYFENLAECLHESERQNKQIKDPTDKFIIEQHCFEWISDREISIYLRSPENTKYKPLGHSQVSNRRIKIVQSFGLVPITIKT